MRMKYRVIQEETVYILGGEGMGDYEKNFM